MKTEWMSGQKKPLERQEHCTCERRYIDTAAWARTALSTHQMLQTASPHYPFMTLIIEMNLGFKFKILPPDPTLSPGQPVGNV